MATVELHGQVVGYLAADAHDYAAGRLEVDDVHHALKRQLVEVETVAHVVVGRYGLGIVVDHYRPVAELAAGACGVDRTPVELYRAAYTVCARAEHHHRLVVMGEVDVVLCAVIGDIQIVG